MEARLSQKPIAVFRSIPYESIVYILEYIRLHIKNISVDTKTCNRFQLGSTRIHKLFLAPIKFSFVHYSTLILLKISENFVPKK